MSRQESGDRNGYSAQEIYTRGFKILTRLGRFEWSTLPFDGESETCRRNDIYGMRIPECETYPLGDIPKVRNRYFVGENRYVIPRYPNPSRMKYATDPCENKNKTISRGYEKGGPNIHHLPLTIFLMIWGSMIYETVTARCFQKISDI